MGKLLDWFGMVADEMSRWLALRGESCRVLVDMEPNTARVGAAARGGY